MTPSERDRRIEAAAKRRYESEGWRWEEASRVAQEDYREEATADLDAADEAVPVVSEEESERRHVERMAPAVEALADANGRAERAEAAARELTEQHALQRAEWARALTAESDRADRLEAELGRCTCPVGWGHVRAADCPRHNPKPAHTVEAHPSFSGEEGTEG